MVTNRLLLSYCHLNQLSIFNDDGDTDDDEKCKDYRSQSNNAKYCNKEKSELEIPISSTDSVPA